MIFFFFNLEYVQGGFMYCLISPQSVIIIYKINFNLLIFNISYKINNNNKTLFNKISFKKL